MNEPAETAFPDASFAQSYLDAVVGDKQITPVLPSAGPPTVEELNKQQEPEWVNVVKGDKARSIPVSYLRDAQELGYELDTPRKAAIRDYLKENEGLTGAAKVAWHQFVDQATFGVAGVLDQPSDDLERAKRDALKEQNAAANVAGGIAGFGLSLLYGGEFFKGAGLVGQGVERAVLGGAERTAIKLAVEGGEETLLKQGVKALTVHGAADAAEHAAVKQSLVAAEEVITKQAAQTLIENGATKATAEAAAPSLARRLIASSAKFGAEGMVLNAPKAITEAAVGRPEDAAETLLLGAGAGAALGFGGGLVKGFKFSKLAGNKGEELSTSLRKGVLGLREEAGNVFAVDEKILSDAGAFESKRGFAPGIISRDELVNNITRIHEDAIRPMAETVVAVDNATANTFSPRNVYETIVNTLADRDMSLSNSSKAALTDLFPSIRDTVTGKIKLSPDRDFVPLREVMRSLKKLDDQFAGQLSSRKIAEKEIIRNAFTSELDRAATEAVQTLPNSNELFKTWTEAFNRYKASGNVLTNVAKVDSSFTSNVARDVASKMGSNVGIGNAISYGGAYALGKELINVKSAGIGAILAYGAKKLYESSTARLTLASALEGKSILLAEEAMKRVGLKIDSIGPKLVAGAAVPFRNQSTVDALNSFIDPKGRNKEKLSSKEAFDRVRKSIVAAQTDPSNVLTQNVGHVNAALSNHGAPNIAAATQNKQLQVVQYLYDRMPKPPAQVQQPNAFAAKKQEKRLADWQPSAGELDKFAKTLAIVQDPLSAVDMALDGSLTVDQMQTLKDVYPYIHGKICDKILDTVTNGDVNLPYNARVKLSALTGIPTDFSTEPKTVAILQSNFAASEEQPQKNRPLNLAPPTDKTNAYMSPSQEVEFS